jgi:hypothetical protein
VTHLAGELIVLVSAMIVGFALVGVIAAFFMASVAVQRILQK